MKFNNASYWLKHGATKDDLAYFEPMITAAEYLDDMYIEEVPIAFVEVDESSGPWVYFNEQKIPNVDERIKTHKEYGFVGKLPSRNTK